MGTAFHKFTDAAANQTIVKVLEMSNSHPGEQDAYNVFWCYDCLSGAVPDTMMNEGLIYF